MASIVVFGTMRLLNALTLQLELFPDPVPDKTPYAILSHTWTHDEVCFGDMKDVSSAQDKAGFAKIRAACAMTRHHGNQSMGFGREQPDILCSSCRANVLGSCARHDAD